MRKPHTRTLAVLVVVSVLVFVYPGAGVGHQQLDTGRYPPPGEMVDIGGLSLHLRCTGSGSPTVILEHGIGANSLDWSMIQPELSQMFRVCAYDRSGYGWSEPSPSARTAPQLAAELHQLVEAAKIQTPLILVAHSFGGVVATSYAARYPDEVAAMVLIDALHPGMFSEHQDVFKETLGQMQGWNRLFDLLTRLSRTGILRVLIPLKIVPWTQAPENLPTDLKDVRTASLSVASHWLAFAAEMDYMRENREIYTTEELRGILEGKPVYVFYGAESAPLPIDPIDSRSPHFVWEAIQSDWRVISTCSRIVEISDADHNSLLMNPEDFKPILTSISELQSDLGCP